MTDKEMPSDDALSELPAAVDGVSPARSPGT